MSKSLQDLANYHGDRLFEGAIDLDWFLHNPKKAAEVASAYVFHGKQYHDINMQDKAVVAGKHLTDSITMVKEILTSLTDSINPMMLAIAGYGAGKSHFALMMANLLDNRESTIKASIIENIRQIDSDEAIRIKSILENDSRPVLVIPINGMRNCNLQQEFFTIAKTILERDGQSLDCFNKFDARFENLKLKVLDHRNQNKMLKVINTSGLESIETFIERMNSFDRICYAKVKKELEQQGEKVFEPQAEGELKDLIFSIAAEHCGTGKYYQSILILFDEFGKYMAFAASAEQRAGSGIMQQLHEGVQAVNNSVDSFGKKRCCTFIGFSQLDLNEYQQSTSMDLSTLNNMKRYVSRFDAAKKYYMSVSFESLVANLIEIKGNHPLDIQNQGQCKEISFLQDAIGDFFQSSRQYPIWSEQRRFIQTVALGCWPLSPLATWTLSYISSINTILQQRSALNILGNVFRTHQQDELSDMELFHIYATDIYDAGLDAEFCTSEVNSTGDSQPAIKLEGVLEKYGIQLTKDARRVLKAIVLCLKLGSYSKSREGAITLISALSGVDNQVVKNAISDLEDNYNVIEFDSRNKLFEIKAGAPSIHEFEKILNRRVLGLRNEGTEYSQLRYVQNIVLSQWLDYPDIFPDIETSFSSLHNIQSLEWSYKASAKASIDFEKDLSDDELIRREGLAPAFFDFKGSIVYLIVPGTYDVSAVKSRILQWIESYHEEKGWKVPIMCLVIHDANGMIFEAAEKITAIDSLSSNEKNAFGSMVDKHRDKLLKTFFDELSNQKMAKHYVSIAQKGLSLKDIGSELFEMAYPEVLPFNMDGFTSSSGNGPNTIKKIILALASGDNNWKSIVDSLNNRVDMTRAITLLQSAWKVVDFYGMFLADPPCKELASLYRVFDTEYENNQALNFADMISTAIRAPYGANASSASLIVFIYYAAHALQRGIQIDGNHKRLADFLAQNEKNLFDTKTKGLKSDIANKICMIPIIRDDERWASLIRQWMNSSIAEELIRYQDEAQNLFDQKVKLPDEFYNQYHANMERSVNARQFLKDWKVECEGLLKDLQVFTSDSQSVPKVIHSLNKFQTTYKSFLKTHDNLLSDFTKDAIDEVLSGAKTHISINLAGWIEAHPFPDDYDSGLSKNLSDGYKSLINALASAGMTELKEILQDALHQGEEKYSYIIDYYKALRVAKNYLDEVKARFVNIEAATVQGLDQSIHGLQIERNKLIDFDTQHRGLINLNMSGIDEHYKETIEALNDQLETRRESFNNLFNITISNIEEMESTERIVRSLLAFYVQDKNEEALHDMLKEIKLLREAYNMLSDYNTTWEQLKEILENQKVEIYDQLGGDACFDDDSILDAFYTEIQQKRLMQSQVWLTTLEKESAKINDISIANKIMSRINIAPVYLAEEHKSQVDVIRSEIEDFLVKQKVEYILSLYRELAEEQKQILLKQLVNERKAEKEMMNKEV